MFRFHGGKRSGGDAEDTSSTTERAACEIEALNRAFVIFRLDTTGKILEINDEFEKVFGHSRAAIVGRHHDIIMRPRDRNVPGTGEIWATLARGEDVTGILPRHNKAGDEVWFDVSYTPVRDRSGRILHVLAVGRHITDYHLSRRDNRGQVDAVRRTMAVIEFGLDGTILWANDLFCKTMGYALDEIKGKHHRMFVPPEEASSSEYRAMWDDLARGGSHSSEVKRLNKMGESRWLQATYSTAIDPEGRPFKVVKYAFDITEAKNLAADAAGQIDAIQRVQAVIEFDPYGKILNANENFCRVMGYEPSEIAGQPHKMFVDAAHARSQEYQRFWEDLRAGKELEGNFERIGKGGKKVWIRASYNPIRDADGRVCKVVKFAVDTTIFQITADTMKSGLERAASGDLTVRLDQNLGDLDGIRTTFNQAISTMRGVISGVVDRSHSLNDETSEITRATDDLAQRTEQQAITLAQASSAVEELNSSVRNAAELATGARDMAGEARSNTVRSRDVVGKAISAMDEISESSQKISSITGLIEEIAFQTNLLALNAGVEAARAGEAGRGFTVVASEVRALAQRSSSAAQDIAQLISRSTEQVGRGVDMVNQAGAALQEIDTSVASVHDRVVEIANFAQEQAIALRDVSSAIQNLDQATQQNAAMAEETSAATQSLKEGIEAMLSDVSYFQQDGTPEIRRRTHAAE